nr:tetratricopeptide repeat protein [uncultured Neisseria sp.]
MKLLLVCFLIAVAIFLFRLMRRSTAKEYVPVHTPDPIQAITQLAEEGNVQAQYELAGLCCNKEPKDYRKAVHWYMKAAEQGHLDAQCLLIMEYSRFLTNRDYELLKQWLHAKAENGDGRTKFSLGKLYLKLSDYEQALYWYRLASSQGYGPADCQIGTMYEYGIGVPQDYKQAEEWFIKGGPYGEPRWHLFMMYSRMASEGDIEAQYKLGFQYRYGGSVDQWDPSFGIDYKQALSLFRKLAEQGHADAQFQLAQMYNDGVGVTQNDVLAIYWYRKAAEQGVASAQFRLGIKYKLGQGFQQDETLAQEWFEKAYSNGYPREES